MKKMIGVRPCILVLSTLLFAGSHLAVPIVRADEPVVKPQQVEAKAASQRLAPTPWLDHGAEFFRQPFVNMALITVGLIGLIFEFKLPGTTLPGAVAAVCFVLFFWSHSFTGHGGIMFLGILLFLLGLVFLGFEVFIVPGLGFMGVAGAGLMFVGLLLAALEQWPSEAEGWKTLGSTFGSIAIALAVAIVGALVLTWSLPNTPFLNRMVLKPPAEEDATALALANSGQLTLLGAIGVAVTHLRPAGKAQFGAQFLDVMAAGDYVPPGGRVKVVEIEGPRVVVKEV